MSLMHSKKPMKMYAHGGQTCAACGGGPCMMAKGGALREDPKHQSGKSGMIRIDTESNQNQRGVNQHGYKGSSGGTSEAGAYQRDYGNEPRAKEHSYPKEIHKQTLSDLRSMPNPKLKGLAEGGEVSEESPNISDMASEELLDAIHRKDKSGIISAMKALMASCMDEE